MAKRMLSWILLVPCVLLLAGARLGAFGEAGVAMSFVLLGASFAVLMVSADGLVAGAVGIAHALRVPEMFVGIVLVSVTTTAPEFVVSVSAALRGEPEFAVGNAVGSVICDDGLALGLMAILAPAPVAIHAGILRSANVFIAIAVAAAFATALDGRYTRAEGLILVAIFGVYLLRMLASEARRRRGAAAAELPLPGVAHEERPLRPKIAILAFVFGVAGVLLSSSIVLNSSAQIASALGIPKVIIGLTLIAFGTSLPEIATCIAAARRGQGAIAAGDILGADILNICWILGMSAVANPIAVRREEILFMFPAMIVILGAARISMRTGHRLRRAEGVLLVALFAIYAVLTVLLFGPTSLGSS